MRDETRPAAVDLLWVLVVVVVLAMTYAAPFLGFFLSLLLLGLPHAARSVLWPSVTDRESRICSAAAWVGLWLPALVGLFLPLLYDAGIEVSTTWLIVPLCAPAGQGPVLVPAAAATAVCLVGLVAARVFRRPWPWVLAAWLAPWVHAWAYSTFPDTFSC